MNLVKFLLLLLPFFHQSCGLNDGLEFAFRMEYPNNTFEIPAGLNTIESHFFVIQDIPTNRDLFFSSVDTSEVEIIIPNGARITSLDGSDIDFDFLFEVSVRLCSKDGSTCGREIFYRDEIPENVGSSLALIPNENNVKEELTSDNYTIEVVLKRLVTPSPRFIRAKIDLVFDARR